MLIGRQLRKFVIELAQSKSRVISILVSHDFWVVFLTALIALLGVCFAEKIPVNNGLGWDGLVYGKLAQEGLGQFTENPLDAYTVRRVLPSIVVHAGLQLGRFSLSDANVIVGFGLLNIFCLTGIAWYWTKIAGLLGIGSRGKWIGFCALILNFAVVKHTSYYPVLTDVPAYAIGCGMLYCYLKRSEKGLFLLTALGAFVWPLLLLQGALLLAFPRSGVGFDEAPEERQPSHHQSRHSNYWIAALLTYYALLTINWSIDHANLPIPGYIDPVRSVLPLSFIVVAVYLFFGLLRLVDLHQMVAETRILVVRDWRRLLTIVALLATVQIVYSLMATIPGQSNGLLYLLRLAIKSVYRPGIFLVGHAVYFGPIVLMIMLLWSEIAETVKRVGFGLSVVVLLSLGQGLDGESRHLIHAFPLIVPFAVLAIERLNWSRGRCLVFALLSAFASKFWFVINSANMETQTNLLEFPLQAYAMNYGVFMNTQTYLIQGFVTAASAALLYGLTRPAAGSAPVSDGAVLPIVWTEKAIVLKAESPRSSRRRYALAVSTSVVLLIAIILPLWAGDILAMGFPPVAGEDVAATTQNRAVTINVLMNDAAPVGQLDLKSVRIERAPAHGQVTLASDAGLVTYRPLPEFTGSDVFLYTVGNDRGQRTMGVVRVTVRR
jgi:hypothetical protein